MMRLFAFGLSHHTAPVDLRERMSVAKADLPRALAAVSQHPGIGEAVVVSTCNRTALYVTCADPGSARAELSEFLPGFHGVAADLAAPHLTALADQEVARHLFRVASGLDSLMVGEPQILGQLKDAWRAAAAERRTGPLLNRTFQWSFTVGKRVRSETGIAEGSVSASAAVVALARKIFGELRDLRVLLIGAGEMAKLAALYLKRQEVASLTIASRTAAHAETVARAIGAAVIPWANLSAALAGADIVVTATGSTTPILSRAAIVAARGRRGRRPIFIIDLGVPRDVDPSAGDIDDVLLYNIDDLRSIVGESLWKRQQHIDRAEAIVAAEADRFAAWYRSREALPAMIALRRRFDAVRQSELGRFEAPLAGLPPDARARVHDVTRLIVEKLLIEPTAHLRALPDEATARAYSDALTQLFDLGDPATSPCPAPTP